MRPGQTVEILDMTHPPDGGRQAPTSENGNGQTRTWSAIESGTTMFVGYLCAVIFYQIVWPLFGYEVQIVDSAAVALLMFPVNYVRQYAVRRAFNWLQLKDNRIPPVRANTKTDASSPFE